jgi:hypothetical protein
MCVADLCATVTAVRGTGTGRPDVVALVWPTAEKLRELKELAATPALPLLLVINPLWKVSRQCCQHVDTPNPALHVTGQQDEMLVMRGEVSGGERLFVSSYAACLWYQCLRLRPYPSVHSASVCCPALPCPRHNTCMPVCTACVYCLSVLPVCADFSCTHCTICNRPLGTSCQSWG